MIDNGKRDKLKTLPWQALYDFAMGKKSDDKNSDDKSIRSKDKNSLIEYILETYDVSDYEINTLVDSYIYGDRVTFTLWNFRRMLNKQDFDKIYSLEGKVEPYLEADGFRGLQIVSVKKYEDRIELLYVYGKEYSYINEEGHNDSIWEQHRGCAWIGLNKAYLASISKHEKMTGCIVSYITEKTGVALTQIKPPKAAIERCVDPIAISRISLQGFDGEKTIVSRTEGLTEAQLDEVSRIRNGRLDTSGSYIAQLEEDTSATIKYNVKKGSIGIYKHLPAAALFAWSRNAIDIIFEEIDQLKERPLEEICKEMGIQIKWSGLHGIDAEHANWFLAEVVHFFRSKEEYTCSIPEDVASLLDNETWFKLVPRVYCDTCESYEIPHCSVCGRRLVAGRYGQLRCPCGARQPIQCSEGHNCQIENWYFPTDRFYKAINQNINSIFSAELGQYAICVTGFDLHIVPLDDSDSAGVEILFDDIKEFHSLPRAIDPEVRQFAIRMNEKCDGTCSKAKVNQCVSDCTMACLPKAFYTILPSFRPQPHKGMEYGDVSAEVHTALHHYEMKGILKKNSMNKGKHKDHELLEEHLLSTSTEGQEIIRQFVEQGMADSRCQLIAIVAPQYFDASLKGTLRYLARIGGKKVLFIDLDGMTRILQANDKIKTN